MCVCVCVCVCVVCVDMCVVRVCVCVCVYVCVYVFCISAEVRCYGVGRLLSKVLLLCRSCEATQSNIQSSRDSAARSIMVCTFFGSCPDYNTRHR